MRRLGKLKATSVWLSHIWALLARPRLGMLIVLWFFQVENFDAELEQKYSDKELKISRILHLAL